MYLINRNLLSLLLISFLISNNEQPEIFTQFGHNNKIISISFSPDGKMVLGADLRVEGLHWAAALGGHGMTCAPAIGRVVAAGLQQKVLA